MSNQPGAGVFKLRKGAKIEPWPEVLYQPLCLNSELRRTSLPVWEVFTFHLILVRTASLEIINGKYFYLACI